MRLVSIAAALAAASIVTVPPTFGRSQDELLGTFILSPSCTPEAHRCLEKLRSLLAPGDGPPYARIEKALLELSETNPECAALLRTSYF